jgi:membrane-bound lytic murein transglycosylase B
VPPRILLSLWGVESLFGTRPGTVPVPAALATLAWDGRRSAFFRRELLEALRILDQGHIAPEAMTGSWAGAMGQFQFMPSTFRRFAVDHDGDGRKDIWENQADAFASAANYLASAGWQPGVGWGQRVRLPKGFNTAAAGLNKRKTYAQWRKLGVKDVRGPAQRPASLLLPEGPGGPAFLVTDNFRVLLDWNRSHNFALAVGLLADTLLEPPRGSMTNAPASSSGKINVKPRIAPASPLPPARVEGGDGESAQGRNG